MSPNLSTPSLKKVAYIESPRASINSMFKRTPDPLALVQLFFAPFTTTLALIFQSGIKELRARIGV